LLTTSQPNVSTIITDLPQIHNNNREVSSQQSQVGFCLRRRDSEEQVVDIKIIDAGEKIKRLYKSLADPKSEAELRSVCLKLLRVESEEAIEAKEAIENLSHMDRQKQPNSKKQLVLGESSCSDSNVILSHKK
jgi:hypothetical protein